MLSPGLNAFRTIEPSRPQNISNLSMRVFEVIGAPVAGAVFRGLETDEKTGFQAQQAREDEFLVIVKSVEPVIDGESNQCNRRQCSENRRELIAAQPVDDSTRQRSDQPGD